MGGITVRAETKGAGVTHAASQLGLGFKGLVHIGFRDYLDPEKYVE